MPKTTRRFAFLLSVGALALAVLAPAATAQKPEPCGGTFLIVDAAGDQAHRQQGQTVMAMPPSTDVLGVFFRVDGGKVTANLALTEVPAAPPSGFAAIRYRMYFTVEDKVRFVQALITSSGPKFIHGQDVEDTLYEEVGPTTGTVHEGPNGVVQVVIPPEVGGKPGTALAATSGTAGLLSVEAPPQGQLAPVYFQADTAPDGSEDGPTTTPEDCSAPAAPTDPGQTQPGQTNPPPSQPPSQPGSQPNNQEVRLTLARAAKFAAKKVNRKRRVSFVLKTTAPVTAVTAQLKKGSKVLGTGKLARLDNQGTVKMKLKRKLSKGAHTLLVTARRSDGSTYSISFKVRVSK